METAPDHHLTCLLGARPASQLWGDNCWQGTSPVAFISLRYKETSEQTHQAMQTVKSVKRRRQTRVMWQSVSAQRRRPGRWDLKMPAKATAKNQANWTEAAAVGSKALGACGGPAGSRQLWSRRKLRSRSVSPGRMQCPLKDFSKEITGLIYSFWRLFS